MENKKYLPFRIIHYVLMIATFVLGVYNFIKNSPADPFLTKLSYLLLVAALVLGFVYAVLDYRKQDAKYYKGFMWAYLISSIIHLVNMFSAAASPVFMAFLNIIAVVLTTMLTTCKDLGKQTSYIVAIGLLLCKIVPLIIYLSSGNFSDNGTNFLGVASGSLITIMLAANAFLMVAGKYIDKDARGAK